MPNDSTPVPPHAGPSPTRRWIHVAALAATASVAGIAAAHSTAWAVGLGTATALFAALHELVRR